jgi:hypothetical protein
MTADHNQVSLAGLGCGANGNSWIPHYLGKLRGHSQGHSLVYFSSESSQAIGFEFLPAFLVIFPEGVIQNGVIGLIAVNGNTGTTLFIG